MESSPMLNWCLNDDEDEYEDGTPWVRPRYQLTQAAIL